MVPNHYTCLNLKEQVLLTCKKCLSVIDVYCSLVYEQYYSIVLVCNYQSSFLTLFCPGAQLDFTLRRTGFIKPYQVISREPLLIYF